jgi:hypothetical protein
VIEQAIHRIDGDTKVGIHVHHAATTPTATVVVIVTIVDSKLVECRSRRSLVVTLERILQRDLEKTSLEVSVCRGCRGDTTQTDERVDSCCTLATAQQSRCANVPVQTQDDTERGSCTRVSVDVNSCILRTQIMLM